jgi:2OG-Fe(II) oxygenase superfamily
MAHAGAVERTARLKIQGPSGKGWMVVRWNGQAMPAHRDHCNGDGSPNATPWREWAGIIYLNDDYTGGRLIFPESGTAYRPVAGALALFPASLLHAVEAGSVMPRYTAPLWFTGDPAHVDPFAVVRP